MTGKRFGLDEGVDAGGDVVAARLEHRRGVVLEIGFAVGGVALVLERLKSVNEAGVEAGRGVVGEAEVDGDAVGGFETDAVDLAGDAVGLLEENGFGLGAVALDQFHALAGRDAVGLEENVEFALRAFGVPSGFDGGGAFRADAGDVAEFAGFFGEDAERVGAEGVDDFIGVGFADAGDEAAAEVFADAVDAGGELAFEGGDFELGAVLRVLGPLAGEVERLAAFDAGQGADDGDFFDFLLGGSRSFYGGGTGVGAKFRDRVMIFLVVENDAFEDAGERGMGGGRWHGRGKVKREIVAWQTEDCGRRASGSGWAHEYDRTQLVFAGDSVGDHASDFVERCGWVDDHVDQSDGARGGPHADFGGASAAGGFARKRGTRALGASAGYLVAAGAARATGGDVCRFEHAAGVRARDDYFRGRGAGA